jgi:hypothetical protein
MHRALSRRSPACKVALARSGSAFGRSTGERVLPAFRQQPIRARGAEMGEAWEWLLVVAVLIGGVAYLRWRASVRAAPWSAGASRPYHCVAVQPHGVACDLVRGIAGERFLAAQAPSLPLPGCPHRDCRCVYVHFEDRRVIDRRALEIPGLRVDHGGIDRRGEARGRRRSDRLSANPAEGAHRRLQRG